MTTPLERMQRKEREIEAWLALLRVAEVFAWKQSRDVSDDDLAHLRMAVLAIKKGTP